MVPNQESIMRTSLYRLFRLGASLCIIAIMAIAGAFGGIAQAIAAPPPASTCSVVGLVRTCELWAKPGTISLPGAASVTIWGYTDSASSAAQLPGPALIANQGETLVVTLHNNLTQPSSLNFVGQDLAPDLVGAAAGATTTYTFSASTPGTYLYEAGLTANGARQVAMGLFGALIVRPATAGHAYSTATSAYDDEALVILSEIDTNLNAAPTTFKMQNYAPRYWLLNGKVYPTTDPIVSSPGKRVLLRYINAGLQQRTLGLLGLRQTMIANDGNLLPYTYSVVADTIGAGETVDALVAIPATAVIGTKYPLYNTANQNRNASIRTSGVLNSGGMVTFLTVAAPVPTADTTGPTTTSVALSHTTTNGASDIILTAAINDSATGNTNVTAAEYTIDAGSAVPMVISTPAVSLNVNATITAATISTLSVGPHTITVRGRDAAGNWGATATTILNVDTTGPATSGLTVITNLLDGSLNLSATITDNGLTPSVVAAEYFIDSTAAGNAAGTAMAGTFGTSPISVTASIPGSILITLANGTHTLYVHGQDGATNWGAFTITTFTVSKTGPTTSNVVVNPALTNGTAPVSITADASDVSSGNANIIAAEYALDGGSATAMLGAFGTPSVSGLNGSIPAATVATLANGSHTVEVRAKDATGTWGAWAATTLTIDKIAPVASALSVSPSATNGATSVVLAATISDSNSALVAAEYAIDTLGLPGSGSAMNGTPSASPASISASISTSTLATLSSGNHTIYVRGQDAAGNWSAAVSVVLNLDKAGPTTSGLTLSPALTNGSIAVNLQATGSDVASGNANVVAAEYTLDASTPQSMTLATIQPISSMTATIPAATVLGLSQGTHTVLVRSQDSRGNWGANAAITLTVDKTGPVASAISVSPTPNNGTIAVDSNTNAVRVSANLSDSVATIVTAEGFIDNVAGAPGTGFPLVPSDGLFNTSSETGYVNIPLGTISQLTNGNHTISIRGKDSAGNWGAFGSATLYIDKVAPVISSVSFSPNPTNGADSATLTAVGSDSTTGGLNITAAEWFIGTDPGKGNATPFVAAFGSPNLTANVVLDLHTYLVGSYTFSVRMKDAAGNWSATSTATLNVNQLANSIFANSFASTASPYGWSSRTGNAARFVVSTAANMKDTGTNGMALNVSAGASGFVTHTIPAGFGASSYHARFYVNPNGATLGSATPTIFAAMSGTTTAVNVQLRLNAGSYQVRAVVNRNGGTTVTNWYAISGSTAIEIAWAKGTSTSFQLYTGGTLHQTLTLLNTNANTITESRLGLSAGVTSAMNGSTIFLDGFVATRSTYVGP